MKIFTIGYGNLKPADFTSKLINAGVKTVIDVRLRPDRAYCSAYSLTKKTDTGIKQTLGEIKYLSVIELGNIFLNHEDWYERYSKFLTACGGMCFDWLDGVEKPICLLCAEIKIEDCHRKIVAEYLHKAKGAEIIHL